MTSRGAQAQRHLRLPELTAGALFALLQRLPPSDYAALLENPGATSTLGRYCFLGLCPSRVFRSRGDEAWVGPPGALEPVGGAPLEVLQTLLAEHQRADKDDELPDLPPFRGGAIGYFGYELLHQLESVPSTGKDDLQLPDCYWVFYGLVLAVDLVERTGWAIATGEGEDESAAVREAEALLKKVPGLLGAGEGATEREHFITARREILERRPRLAEEHLTGLGIRSAVQGEPYREQVRRAKEHIAAGDVFEVCLTNRYETSFENSGLALYEVLRATNPGPFSAYLRFPEVEILSSSPERYLRLDGQGWAESSPIKGTRPRGATPALDRALHDALASSVKDRAENVMIVDLVRNDLGRVCRFGTVRVSELFRVESYPYTHQLVSTVRGKLEEGKSIVDLIRASFPGGSMTGAPKIEAMKIIDRLEPIKRAIYSGCIGYLDRGGRADLSIVIRTFFKVGERLTFHVGGAIVSDSDPADEYQEILDKAQGLVVALEVARASP